MLADKNLRHAVEKLPMWARPSTTSVELSLNRVDTDDTPSAILIGCPGDITGRAHYVCGRFSTAIFRVIVGAGQVEYLVHETYLCKSPVFARMQSRFKEALEKRITLPEEQPSHLEAIIGYLYTDDFGGRGNPQPEMDDTDKAVELAHLYVSAAKYGLEAMIDVIVGKLRLCTKPDDFDDWLEVAEIIYESVPSNRDPYRVYFRSLIRSLISKLLTSADNLKASYVNGE
ncbi:MAG: hypothetical protein Q9226_006123 [Calogaya cf. arnoldii]